MLFRSRHLPLDASGVQALHHLMERIYLRRDRNFGNAREVRRLFDATLERQSERLQHLLQKGEPSEEALHTLTAADLPSDKSDQVRTLDEVLNDLNALIGMKSVKNMVQRLAVQSMFLKQRSVQGVGHVQQLVMNFILTGNPGTGKTTVARIMGEVLQSMDILPTHQVIEATRATLVGKYMGETPKLVNQMCDHAMGGILFIDEAYTLCGDNDPYGHEAIETLMKRMEDDREIGRAHV